MEKKHPSPGQIGCGYLADYCVNMTFLVDLCSSADCDSRGVGCGLRVCISNKFQEITMLLFFLGDKATDQIFYWPCFKLPGCQEEFYINKPE